MPVSPAIRFSPGREPRADNHKRGRSLENGISFKERDDDLALFNEVQNKESDNFLLQSNDDFEDTFVNKLRHFSDHKLEINIATRGESSDLLNTEEEKNDYEWLITPPDTPLFPSFDDETPQVIIPQRGRPRAQPISISRSSTMEKNHRTSRGSPSPNRLSPSPRSREPAFQPRTRATSAPSSSPPPSRRPESKSKRPSTPPSRRLSTGSVTPTRTPARGISVNSPSPKVKAWQANIPGFSTEAPPNLRTSLADRPASYIRGSSPASRNGRHSMSPVASRSISSSYSKGSVGSSGDEDIESIQSVIVDGSQRLNSRRAINFKNNNNNHNINININNKAPFSPNKPNRSVASSSAPKRSFDLALRQMDHRKGSQNMFRPLLSSVHTSNLYAGKASPAWHSSVATTSSNASSNFGTTSGPHDIQENEIIDNDDDATSKTPNCNIDDDEVFMFEKTDSVNLDAGNESNDISANSVNFPEFETMLVCSRCGCEYSVIGQSQTEDDVKLCEDCRKSTSCLTVSDPVIESTITDKDDELVNTVKSQLTQIPLVKIESLKEHELTKVNHEVIVSQPVLSYSDAGSVDLAEPKVDSPELKVDYPEQNIASSESKVDEQELNAAYPESKVDFSKSKVDFSEKEGISVVLKRSTSIAGPFIRPVNLSASSISYDDFSYVRDSTNSIKSSIGRCSFSASSSIDCGPRFHRQSSSSKKSDIENYKFDPVNVKQHQRSVSSQDSFEVSNNIVHADKDIADSASVIPQENDTCTENESLNAEDQNPEKDTGALATCTVEIVEELGKDTNTSALTTCTFEEGTSDVAEVELGVISEGEFDNNICDSSSSSSVSQCSESNIEEFRDPHVSIAIDKDVEISAIDCDTVNHSGSILEESTSTVLVEGEKGRKGKSLTLEEATDTILFCSSIVHNLAYEAATLAIEKEDNNNNNSFPLIPAVPKTQSGQKDDQIRRTNKRSSKSQKTKRKTMDNDTAKDPNTENTSVSDETDLPKTRIVHSNNKENTEPLKLESKCNCMIM